MHCICLTLILWTIFCKKKEKKQIFCFSQVAGFVVRILSTFIIRPRLNLRRDSIFIASNHSWKLLLIPHHHHHHHHYHHSYPQARVSWCDQCYVPGPPHPWHHERRRGVQHCPGFSLVVCLFCLCFTCLSFCSLFLNIIDTFVLLSALLPQME